MLGDIPERSKNPLKKAMRRRNAKMVTFAAPQYREASEVEWSESESDSGDMGVMQSGGLEHQQEQEFVDHDTAVVHSNGQLNVGPGNEPTIATSTQQTSSIQQYGVDSQDQQGTWPVHPHTHCLLITHRISISHFTKRNAARYRFLLQRRQR